MAMTVGRRIVVGFAVPLVLLISVASFGYLALRRQTVQLQELTVQQDHLLNVGRMTRTGIRDAERPTLDYLLTGNPIRIAERRQAIDLADSGIVLLRHSPGVQTLAVDSLAEQFTRWRQLSEQMIVIGERQGLDAARKFR